MMKTLVYWSLLWDYRSIVSGSEVQMVIHGLPNYQISKLLEVVIWNPLDTKML